MFRPVHFSISPSDHPELPCVPAWIYLINQMKRRLPCPTMNISSSPTVTVLVRILVLQFHLTLPSSERPTPPPGSVFYIYDNDYKAIKARAPQFGRISARGHVHCGTTFQPQNLQEPTLAFRAAMHVPHAVP
ncbi:hypothetical protein PAXINDRAFT_101918 [Paxillus involutus ATCC 200175]|uniref:Uncharacterized protein n=1 Tax=Paxillus involutus ATCC 200175 TaxID=664439 RepID=A0A0C9SRX7_PAXIN|nr:hypothetical protein PAXINDRAFT_101918 [Paxillus involutus ATCC 200175]